jgi:EAL domain-containing protein (putative c-di-GMP-specific phosphodiesterase class I)
MIKTRGILEATDPTAFLKTALAQNDFELYAQPVMALKGPTQYPMVEVFVRMREEEAALLPPGEFLPVLEAFRLMPLLDRWVVRETLVRTRGRSAFRSFCVNVSRQTMEDPKFPGFLASEVRLAGIAAERLTFELTEHDVTASLRGARTFCDAVRQIGAQVVIEDFSCREPSFDVLRIVRADYVKIHSKIVRSLTSRDISQDLVKRVIQVSASRGVRVMAEAVEDQETLALLRALGLDFAQGFAISRPVPLASI